MPFLQIDDPKCWLRSRFSSTHKDSRNSRIPEFVVIGLFAVVFAFHASVKVDTNFKPYSCFIYSFLHRQAGSSGSHFLAVIRGVSQFKRITLLLLLNKNNRV